MGKWKREYNLTRKYNPRWEDGRKWLLHTDDGKCYCELCKCTFQAKKSVLTQHENTAKHKSAISFSLIKRFIKIKREDNDNETFQNKRNIDETVDFNSTGISVQCSEANIEQIDEPKKTEKFQKRIRTADGNYIIIESQRIISDPKENSVDEIKKLTDDVVGVFKNDLENFLRKNECVMRSVQRNPDFMEGKSGLTRVTRMLVGQVAQQYLMDYTIDSWKSGTSPGSTDLMASKLGAIEEMMEKSAVDVRNIKQQLECQHDELGEAGIVLANINIGL